MKKITGRPIIATPEMISSAAEEVAKKACNMQDSDRAVLAENIIDVYYHNMSTFELCKELEKLDWPINSFFFEDMEYMETLIDRKIHQAATAWAVGIEPPLEVGTIITKGEITGICDHSPASYLVKTPGHCDKKEGYRRLIIRFEDAEVSA